MRQKNPKYMKEIEAFVDDFYSKHHKTPSCREIAENTTLQRSAVQKYLTAMNDQGMIKYDGRTIRTRRMQSYAPDTTSVGVIGTIACGPLSMEEEAVEQYVDLPTSLFGSGDFFILHASGKQEEAHNGDIVVAYIEGEGNTLKRFKRYGRTVFLHPENPKYTDIPLKNCKIQGVAVWIFKQVS